MIKISEIEKQYSISKSDLLNLLKEHTWKEYSPKTSRIGDSVFEKIKPFLWKNNKIKKEKLTKDKISTKKCEKETEVKKKQISTKRVISSEDNIKKSRKVSKKHTDSKWKKQATIAKKEHKTLTSHDLWWMDFLASTLWIDSKKEEKQVKNNKKIKESENKKVAIKVVKKEDLPVKSKKTNSKKDISKTQESKVYKTSFKVNKKADIAKKKEEQIKRSKPQAKKVDKKLKVSDTLKKKDKIVIWDTVSVKELSEKMWVPANEIIRVFILNWMPVGINSSVDFETVALLADDFMVKVERENVQSWVESMFEGDIDKIVETKNSITDNLKERPPIVTIMGHVDHWKTKLLDYVRKTDIVGWEAGGITQSIWASQITHNWKKITFIDTPWHELFTAMRARWAKITDIAVIVVAADEGVKPQTIEAINHAKDAGVSIIVAITKIDKPNINIDLVKSQVSEQGLMPEDWGGDIPFVWLSAITWEWVDELLEYILLQAEMLELKYNPDVPGVWVILEGTKDNKMWTLATLLLITGTLNKKDSVVAYDVYGKIRLMKDWTWKVVRQVHGWDPVQVMWFEDVPQSWRIFEVFPSDKEAQKQVWKIKELIKKQNNQTVLSSLLDKMKAWEKVELKVILKAWDFGWLEALKYAVWKVKLPEWVDLKIIHEEVGQVKETDISLAEASWAFIFGFDSSIQSVLKKKLEQKKIIFKNFTIIYELLDYIEKLASWMIEKEVEEVYIGKFEMIAMFYKKWNDMILWGKVIDWVIKNGAHFIIKRWDEELWGWKVTSLKIDKENVNEVKAGRECWIRVRTWKRFKEWDILEMYVYEK